MEISNKSTGQQLSLWTSSVVDIPASPLAPQAKEEEQMTLDTYGHGLEQPLASYDHNTQSWRTSEDISLWGDYKLLENLPKSGMTRNGVLYQQPDWVRPIDEIASSLWPTPVTVDAPAGPAKKNPNLIDAVRMRPNLGDPAPTTQEFREQRMWPTPVSSSSMAEDISTVQERLKNGKPYKSRLIEAVAMWPTPKSSDHKAAVIWPIEKTHSRDKALREAIAEREPSAIGGKLNPMWVEWLMGFPTGWTDLED